MHSKHPRLSPAPQTSIIVASIQILSEEPKLEETIVPRLELQPLPQGDDLKIHPSIMLN